MGIQTESEVAHEEMMRELQEIKTLRIERAKLERKLEKVEVSLRAVLFQAKSIVNLARKFNLDRYIDKDLEVVDKPKISIKLNGKTVLTGSINPKQGGWHVIVLDSRSEALKSDLRLKLGAAKRQLEKRLRQAGQANALAEEEKTILKREEIRLRLIKDISELKIKLKKLGAV